MIKTLGLVLFLVWLTVSTVSAQQPVLQPRLDTIQLDVSDDGCEGTVFWSDGFDTSERIRIAIDGLFLSDRLIDDRPFDQSRAFDFDIEEGRHRITAILRGNEDSELDVATRLVDCEPRTREPAPREPDPRKVKTHAPDDTQLLLLCPDGRIIAVRAGERCNFGFPQCGYNLPAGYYLPPCGGQPYSAPSPCGYSVCQPYSVPTCQFQCVPGPQSQGTQFTSTQPPQQQQQTYAQPSSQSAPVQQSAPTTYAQPSTASAPTQQSVTTQSSTIKAPNTGDGGLLR